MGYLFLILAVFAAAAKGYMGKMCSQYIKTVSESITLNLLRILLCLIISCATVLISAKKLTFVTNTVELGIYLLSGISTAVFLICWLFAVKSSAYMLISVFTSSGIIVTLIFGFLIFGETVKPLKIAGLILLITAMVCFLQYNRKIKHKLSVKETCLLTAVLIGQGMINVSQKMFTLYIPGGDKSIFNLYTYLVAFIALGVVWTVKDLKSARKSFQIFKKPMMSGYTAAMSVMLFVNSYCLTAATEYMPSVILFPLNSCLCLIATSFISVLLLKENVKPSSITGTILMLCALVLFNINAKI